MSQTPEAFRIALTHPSYIYPPTRNPYREKLKEFSARVYCDNEAEALRGLWVQNYLKNAPVGTPPPELHLEVGCNAGHVLIEWAKAHPERLFVGIDWKFKAIHRAAEKCEQLGLKNLFLIRAHAERLHYIFAPGELDEMNLFFPDPWAKNSQVKNRWFSTERLVELAPLLKSGRTFLIKTDHPEYFAWMVKSAQGAAQHWEMTDLTYDLHAGHPNPKALQIPEVTVFERLFIKQGLPIHRMRLIRR